MYCHFYLPTLLEPLLPRLGWSFLKRLASKLNNFLWIDSHGYARKAPTLFGYISPTPFFLVVFYRRSIPCNEEKQQKNKYASDLLS